MQQTMQSRRAARPARPKREGPNPLVRAIRYLGRYRRLAIIAYSCLIVATLAQLMVPQITQSIIDAVVSGYVANTVLALPTLQQGFAITFMDTTREQLLADQAGAQGAMIASAIAIVIFAITRGVFSFLQTYMAERVSQSVAFDFRNELFAKIQRLSFSYHDRNQTGQLMIRATDDVEKVRGFIGQGLLLTLQALILLVGTLIILAFTNFSLTLTVLPILPLAVIVFMVFGAVAQPLFGKVQQRLDALNSILQENVAGIKVIRAFVRERQEQERFNTAADALMNQMITVGRTFSFLFPFIFLIANLGQSAVLYFGGAQMINGTLTLGEYQKFSLYLVYIFLPLGQLGFIISLLAQAAASADRMFEIVDAKNDVTDKPDAVELASITGRVEFRDVTFRYYSGGDAVLSHINFVVQPGQTVALLGATGSGKTTIINLLPRFYDVTEGAVLIDNQDVRDVKIDSLRGQIGIVLQETTLFSGTIAENIAYGRPDASLEDIVAAAKAAAAHDFIISFPEGYDTPVGERGSTLSGGQKQRIAIARALMLDPRVLILDDSTSAIDMETEYRIQQALDYLMKNRTSFVIAQRISTVMNADLILVLEKGQIVAQGTHAELLEDSAVYADIYHSQLMSDSSFHEVEPVAEEMQ